MPRVLLFTEIRNFPNSSCSIIVVWNVSNTLNSGTRVEPLKCSALTMLSYVTSKGSSVSESAGVGDWRCRRCIAVNMNSIWTLLWSLMATLPQLNWLWDVAAAFSHMSRSPIQSWRFFKISSHLREKKKGWGGGVEKRGHGALKWKNGRSRVKLLLRVCSEMKWTRCCFYPKRLTSEAEYKPSIEMSSWRLRKLLGFWTHNLSHYSARP